MREILLLREDVRNIVVPKELEVLPGKIVGVPALNPKRKRDPDSLFLKHGNEVLKGLHEGGNTCHLLFIQILKLKLGKEDPVMKFPELHRGNGRILLPRGSPDLRPGAPFFPGFSRGSARVIRSVCRRT